MANYDNLTNTANTLWNSDSSGLLAYSEQVKDGQIKWLDYHYVDEDGNTVYPFQSKTDVDKFQDKLNAIFLKHYNDFQAFLNSKLNPDVIDSWKDIEDFLEGISDDEAMTLLTFISNIELASGTLNIRMSEDYPGAVEAVEISPDYNVKNSKIDPETGAIKIVFNFERDI